MNAFFEFTSDNGLPPVPMGTTNAQRVGAVLDEAQELGTIGDSNDV